MKNIINASIIVMCGAIGMNAGIAAAQDTHINDTTYFKGATADPLKHMKGMFKMPTLPKKEFVPNTMSPALSAEAKMRAMQTIMSFNPFSLRQMIGWMVSKKKVEEGISFDEVMESMNVRANAVNMKKVGHNVPYKIMDQIRGKKGPRIEIVSYCDVPVMFDIIRFAPEFSVFVPCRITVLEDAKGQIWITSLDWDVRWLDTSKNPNKISAKLRKDAIRIREAIESIMEAGATGDL